MSKINIYTSRWELERQVDSPTDIADEWMIELREVKHGLATLTPVNNRYLVYDAEVYKKLGQIRNLVETSVLDIVGESLDQEDDKLIQYQVQLKQEVERSTQYKYDLEEVSRKFVTLSHTHDELLKGYQESKEQVQVLTTDNQNKTGRLNGLIQDKARLSSQLQAVQTTLAQVTAVLKGEELPEELPDIPEDSGDKVEEVKEVKSPPTNNTRTLPLDKGVSKGVVDTTSRQVVPGSKKVKTARVEWEKLLSSPDFPLINDLREKSFWHVMELSSKLSKPPRSITTDYDLDYIITHTFANLGYKKDKPNGKLLSPVEAVWVILATYYTTNDSMVGLEKLKNSVEVIYPSWKENKELITKLLKQG